MKVLFFAQCRQVTGCDHFLLRSYRSMTEAEFWAALIEAFPGLAPFRKNARLARNETYLQGDEMIQPGDEIAVIPPVSGG
jgi:molybdopterin converting factor subunit 1